MINSSNYYWVGGHCYSCGQNGSVFGACTLPGTNMVTRSSPPVWFVDFVFQTGSGHPRNHVSSRECRSWIDGTQRSEAVTLFVWSILLWAMAPLAWGRAKHVQDSYPVSGSPATFLDGDPVPKTKKHHRETEGSLD